MSLNSVNPSNLNNYIVSYISEDNHKIELRESAKDEKQAIRDADDHLLRLGWDSFVYKFHSIVQILDERV